MDDVVSAIRAYFDLYATCVNDPSVIPAIHPADFQHECLSFISDYVCRRTLTFSCWKF